MATCSRCERSHFGMLELKNGLCKKCREEMESKAQERGAVSSSPDFIARADKVMLTTEDSVDFPILERVEIVTAECAFGMNVFKDLFAGVRDITGGRSVAVQETLRDSRRIALLELKKEAALVGANAVIGVDLDYVELSASGSMILLVASGTAVKM